MTGALIVAIVGAESTGKTSLALALEAALRSPTGGASPGRSVARVPETLREFCDAQGRTPRIDEQWGIAEAQGRRIAEAALTHNIVIADTTALMTAVYSDQVFGDRSLHAMAQAAHRRCHLTLLTALDLPWQPDGLQRDGPHVREPVDAKIRAFLMEAGSPFSVVMGAGPRRLANALTAVHRALKEPVAEDAATAAALARWQWRCERCGDSDCERRLLPALG